MALSRTSSSRRMFVFYEDWFDDFRGAIDRLAAFLEGGKSAVPPDIHEAISRFFRADLRRADAHEETPLVLAAELDAMYDHLRLVSAADDPTPRSRLRNAHVAKTLAEGYHAREDLEQAVRFARQEAACAQAEVDRLRESVQDLEISRAGLSEELDRSRQWLDGIQGSTSWKVTAPLRDAKRRLRARNFPR
jgi:hypothetical protein